MLVAAVLGPEQGEDRELEVVGIALEQLDDPGELPVRQPERPVDRNLQRLFDDPGQSASLPVGSDGIEPRKGTSAAVVGVLE
ncbi:MAG: hypothetical protein MSC30_17840 [Gaiellaceae bacterium MAG52_C11]|nr:hypothetical protein [Candidatus Gaiellasilicea maunaloa]